MRKGKFFVWVPVSELHAAFVTDNQELKTDPTVIVVADGLTLKNAKIEVSKIRRGHKIVENSNLI